MSNDKPNESLLNQLYLLKRIYEASQKPEKIMSSLTDKEKVMLLDKEPTKLTRIAHDEVIQKLKEIAANWTLEEAANAFIASFWSAPAIWRGLLIGKLLGDNIPLHKIEGYGGEINTCKICGIQEENTIDEARIFYSSMMGRTPLDGVPKDYLIILKELERETVPKPTKYDCYVFYSMLQVINNTKDNTRYSVLKKELKKQELLILNTDRTYVRLLEDLGLIGLLDTPNYPGLATQFTTYFYRDQRPSVRTEVQAPLAWWDSTIGINLDTLERLFGHLDFDFDAHSVVNPEPKREETILWKVARKNTKPKQKFIKTPISAGTGSVIAGDVYAIKVKTGQWVTIYCHKLVEDRVKGEFLQGIFLAFPSADELILKVQPRRDGERGQFLIKAIDKTSWVRRITRDIKSNQITAEASDPTSAPFCNAKELAYLAENWYFNLE